MSCVLVLLFLLIFGVGVTAVIRSLKPAQGGVSPTYQWLAQRLHGQCDPGGWFRYPRLRFSRADAAVEVQSYRAPELGPWLVTEVRIFWTDPGWGWRAVWPRSQRPAFVPPTLRETTVGDAEFDGNFRTFVSADQDAGRHLNHAVRAQLEKVRRVHPVPLLAAAEPRSFTVQTARVLGHHEELLLFIEMAIELYDQVMLQRTHGVEFVEGQEAFPLDEAVCRVCGEKIAHDLVFCRRCKTPHHRDCWLYAGRCSVFGCGAAQFEVPRVAEQKE